MKRRAFATSREALAQDLASLSELSRQELVDRFRSLYGRDPPRQISRPLLVLAVGYRMQEKIFGGLKPKARRLLARATDDIAAGQPVTAPRRKIKSGTRLLREWRGVTHEAIMVDDGVLFRGQRYRSLSEVARVITGTRWSGPLFFGLRAVAKGASSDTG
jgi:hypothetical protein